MCGTDATEKKKNKVLFIKLFEDYDFDPNWVNYFVIFCIHKRVSGV